MNFKEITLFIDFLLLFSIFYKLFKAENEMFSCNAFILLLPLLPGLLHHSPQPPSALSCAPGGICSNDGAFKVFV
jgi:hypothetical protein